MTHFDCHCTTSVESFTMCTDNERKKWCKRRQFVDLLMHRCRHYKCVRHLSFSFMARPIPAKQLWVMRHTWIYTVPLACSTRLSNNMLNILPVCAAVYTFASYTTDDSNSIADCRRIMTMFTHFTFFFSSIFDDIAERPFNACEATQNAGAQ